VKETSEAIAKLCAEFSVPYFDSYAPLLASSTFLADVKAVDGTHPSAVGYAQWPKLIDAWPAWRAWLP
jgi:acyl-CoA thioesterase I